MGHLPKSGKACPAAPYPQGSSELEPKASAAPAENSGIRGD
jgi:hypothetical protein